MIEALKSDVIVRKVGGRFKLSVLMQKRMVDVAFGAPLLVDGTGKTLAEAVVQEILEDKISLDLTGGLSHVKAEGVPAEPTSSRKSRRDEDDE
jgi:DNA-directed RNA polymerase subunit omega